MCATRLSLLSSLPSSVVSLMCPTIDTRSYTADSYNEEYSFKMISDVQVKYALAAESVRQNKIL